MQRSMKMPLVTRRKSFNRDSEMTDIIELGL